MDTYETALIKLAESVSDLKEKQHHDGLQRRNQTVDVYGMEFTRQGDTNSPAIFYISISQDLIYYERFEFKIILQPFVIPVSTGGVNPTMIQANIKDPIISQQAALKVTNNETETHKHTIIDPEINLSPNPHRHTVTAGVTLVDSTVQDFKISIEGVELTPYFKAQFDGAWIHEQGVFPKSENRLLNYDVLAAVGYMCPCERDKILKSGYKEIKVEGKGIFNVTLVSYLKYSHVNR